MNKQMIEKKKPLLLIYIYRLLSEDKGLQRDESNAEKLRKKWPQYIESMGGRDPFYNDNLSYAHEDFRIKTK